MNRPMPIKPIRPDMAVIPDDDALRRVLSMDEHMAMLRNRTRVELQGKPPVLAAEDEEMLARVTAHMRAKKHARIDRRLQAMPPRLPPRGPRPWVRWLPLMFAVLSVVVTIAILASNRLY